MVQVHLQDKEKNLFGVIYRGKLKSAPEGGGRLAVQCTLVKLRKHSKLIYVSHSTAVAELLLPILIKIPRLKTVVLYTHFST